MKARLCYCSAAVACLAAAVAAPAVAGNMTLALEGVSPVEVTAFATGAVGDVDLSGGGGGKGKVAYKEFTFSAPQNPATPVLALYTSNGKLVREARLQVMSSDGLRLLSEWTLSNVGVASFDVESGARDDKAKAPNTFQAPETRFTLRFTKYCYKVFAADGSVSGQMCYDLSAGTGV